MAIKQGYNRSSNEVEDRLFTKQFALAVVVFMIILIIWQDPTE